jgi:hypothetical protein
MDDLNWSRYSFRRSYAPPKEEKTIRKRPVIPGDRHLLETYYFRLFQHFNCPKTPSGLSIDVMIAGKGIREFITLCVAKRTRPNEPVPSVTPTSKSSNVKGVGSVLTEGFDIFVVRPSRVYGFGD